MRCGAAVFAIISANNHHSEGVCRLNLASETQLRKRQQHRSCLAEVWEEKPQTAGPQGREHIVMV